MDIPSIGILMGDAAGIGPELIIKSLMDKTRPLYCSFFVIGNFQALQRAADSLNKHVKIQQIQSVERNKIDPETIFVLNSETENNSNPHWGIPSAANGANSISQIKTAVDLALSNKIDGIVIAPLNKEAMQMASFQFSDEIEYLGSLSSTNVRTVVTWKNLFRASVTGHIPLRIVPNLITQNHIVPVIENLNNTMKRMDIILPKIGVAALNPNAGEGGTFGNEEICEITPAIGFYKKMGIVATGPHPADTIFIRALNGEFNGIVFLYHDQGYTPMHITAFGEG